MEQHPNAAVTQSLITAVTQSLITSVSLITTHNFFITSVSIAARVAGMVVLPPTAGKSREISGMDAPGITCTISLFLILFFSFVFLFIFFIFFKFPLTHTKQSIQLLYVRT